MEQDDNYVQKTVKRWWQELSWSWDGCLYMWLREAVSAQKLLMLEYHTNN